MAVSSATKERFMQILSLVRAIAFCSVFVVCGCASGPDIRVDMDPTANLRSFRTFAFFQPVSADSSQYTTLVGSRLKQATRAQLERIGFVYSENDPDLRVNLFIKVVDKQQVRSSGSGYYSYRGGYYGTWSGYPYVETIDYREGTLSIDLVDAKRKQLVWQGVAEGEVSDEALKDPGPAVEKVVTRMFSNFPNAPE
jgi:hypothetical protein